MMNNSSLLIIFSLLCFIALAIMLYPLRKNKGMASLLMVFCIIAITVGYRYWGGWLDWQSYLHQEVQQKRVQAALETIKSPQELIFKLKTHLQANPKSARGWYLLGRLYASQTQWSQACDAFAKLRQLRPQDEAALLNYVQSLWQLNYQQFNDETRDLIKTLLEKNPRQADALAMLALDAFTSHDYQSAIRYWQRLLALTPQQSAEAQVIRKAIARAQEKRLHFNNTKSRQ